MADSSISIPTPDWRASSLRVVASPPRVGSRMTRNSAPLSSMASTKALSGAESETMGASKVNPSRWESIAMPCSPTLPDSRILSPGRARFPERSSPSRATPTPVVVMKTPSPFPFSITLVSPVTMRTPDCVAARAIDSTIRCRSANGRPSSRTNEAAR